eukprot:2542105-Rhodomonas_salina.1
MSRLNAASFKKRPVISVIALVFQFGMSEQAGSLASQLLALQAASPAVKLPAEMAGVAVTARAKLTTTTAAKAINNRCEGIVCEG